jgi:hypothetical protein
MKKLIIPFILLFVFFAVGVHAVSDGVEWWGEANAGLQSNTAYYTGFSFNYPNPLENVTSSSYSKCSLSLSAFTPVL